MLTNHRAIRRYLLTANSSRNLGKIRVSALVYKRAEKVIREWLEGVLQRQAEQDGKTIV